MPSSIIADSQSAGRGQHARAWQSPVGGLYLSAIVEQVPQSARDKLALLAGVSVANALANLAPVQLRWPNDIMLQNKKLGGILCESLAQGANWASIIGIGLNINIP